MPANGKHPVNAETNKKSTYSQREDKPQPGQPVGGNRGSFLLPWHNHPEIRQ